MNAPTILALLAIGIAILVPTYFHWQKRKLGRVAIRFAGETCHPEKPIAGNVTVQLAAGGQTGPVRLTLRCTERLKGEGPLPSAERARKTIVLSDGIVLDKGLPSDLAFSVSLPADPRSRDHTRHATRGAMPKMLRRDYDWWCIAEVETPAGATLDTIARVPLQIA